MSEISFDLRWPVASLRGAERDVGARRAHVVLLVAVAASLLLHAIAIYSLRFRREGGLINAVPVEILEWPPQAASPAKRPGTQNAPAELVAPLESGAGEPALNAIAPAATALGALWTQVCASLDAAERVRLHLPDCNRPPPSVWNREAAAALRLQYDEAARAQAASERRPEIKRVQMDDVPKPVGVDLSNAVMPRASPNFGAGSKTGDEDTDDRAQLKALWYLEEHPER